MHNYYDGWSHNFILQLPRGIDDIKKVAQQLDELNKKIEDAKELAMVILPVSILTIL